MRLFFEPASPTHSPSFGLAESIDSDESFASSSIESSKFSDFFSSSSPSSPSSSSQTIDNLSSSTTSNLWSTIFTPTVSSTSLPISTPATVTTTISSLLSSISSSPSTIEPLISESTAPANHYYPHHNHHHPVTPFTATLPTRIIDFGDKFVREEQRCVALVPESYDPITSTLCGLAVFIGLIYILAGYRLFRSTLFLTGFLISSSLVYTLIGLTSSPIPFLGTLVVSLSVGLLTGLVTFLVAWIGLFCLGFNLGTFIGTIIIISIHLLSPHVDTLSPPQSIWVTFSVIAGWGIIGAFSTLYFQKG